METLFITVRVLDVIDILLVSFLLYQLYMLLKGTSAINIFIGIFSVYLLWLIVKALNMELLGSILGQVIGVGVIALIVIFQQEIRRFLLIVGTRSLNKKPLSLERLFSFDVEPAPTLQINSITKACSDMSKTKTGALIIISRQSKLVMYSSTGEMINANTSSRLLENIFFKNSPLHDGAVIIIEDKIYAAGCILPISENPNLPPKYGLRHRAALGITEHTDAIAVVVSEETGAISIAEAGHLHSNLTTENLTMILKEKFLFE
jgi:diadenylate cyclase